jgi:hypothetical protein
VDGELVGADSVWPGPTYIPPSFGCPVSLPSGVQFQLPCTSLLGPHQFYNLKAKIWNLDLELELELELLGSSYNLTKI